MYQMRYHVLHIENNIAQEWQKDLFDQHICELGVDTIDGKDYYIQSELWEANHEDIEAFCQWTEGIELLGAEACPDENWNAAWEAEHPIQELPMGVRIVPHCAFGAGHHETTAMLIELMQTVNLQGTTVLDNGCGTGVLGIMAAKCGATKIVAVDIDDNSVENTRENAALNNVEIEVHLGATPPEGRYDLIMSNIHRNILLAQMPLYAAYLKPEGELWLSGFMEEDCDILLKAALEQGLRHLQTYQNGEWFMLELDKHQEPIASSAD